MDSGHSHVIHEPPDFLFVDVEDIQGIIRLLDEFL